MCVGLCVCIVCECVCVQLYLCACVQVHVCMCASVCVYRCVCVQSWVCVYAHACGANLSPLEAVQVWEEECISTLHLQTCCPKGKHEPVSLAGMLNRYPLMYFSGH